MCVAIFEVVDELGTSNAYTWVAPTVISAFRQMTTGVALKKLRGASRAAVLLARMGALLTVVVFFADTINADILYAAIAGDVQFQDNPLILDSSTDSTSVIPASLAPHVNYFQLAKFDNGKQKQVGNRLLTHFHGTTIIEDVDSPSVLDGETTATLSYSVAVYDPTLIVREEGAIATLDRTITYSRLQI